MGNVDCCLDKCKTESSIRIQVWNGAGAREPLSAPLLILIWASLTAFCLLFWGGTLVFSPDWPLMRVLAIELKPKEKGIEGALVLPLGHKLDERVTLQIDDGKALDATLFRICVLAGCVTDFRAGLVVATALAAAGSSRSRPSRLKAGMPFSQSRLMAFRTP
ncbi:invasion associated locus B family protein [Limoniibacter endophyticus]|uniref:invasion associated locus B family protein n=1 Tax=Limoniibacter endophyticus TaxID=1565040 RepID=UPI001675E509|nr:invasion associated locus B family protein [Limoniibacter endophyticus]